MAKMLPFTTIALLSILPIISTQQSVTFDYTSSSKVLYAGNRIRGATNRTSKDFVLGGLFPIHASSGDGGGCGAVRLERGLERMEAMLYSIDAINADDTLLPNITLGYDIRDTCSIENIGLDETVDLVITNSELDIASCHTGIGTNSTNVFDSRDAPTSAIIGAAGSRVSVPVASLVRLFTTPQVSYASSSALLSNRDRYRYFHRTIPPDNLQARAMIDMMVHFNWTYVSTIYSVNTYGQPGIDAFHKLANELGICIDIDRGIEDDFTAEQFRDLAETLILNSKANVIILFTSQDNAGNLFKYINASSTKRRFTWIASDSWARSNSVAGKYTNVVAGLIGFVPFTRHLDGFHNYFSQLKLSNNHRNPWFEEFFVAVTNCNKTSCTKENSVPSHVDSYEQGNFIPLVVDAVYTVAHALHNFLKDNCQQPVQWFSSNRTCLGQSRELDGSALLEYIQKSNFTSPTGNKIVFDNEGNVEGLYEVLNYQFNGSNFTFQSMGVWNSSVSASGQALLQLNESIPFQFGMERGKVITMVPESHCSRCAPGNIRREVPSSCCGLCEPCLGRYYSTDSQSNNCSTCPEHSWGNEPTTGNSRCVQLEETYLRYSHPYSAIIMIIALAGFIPVAFAVILYIIKWNTPIVKSSGREQMLLLLLGISLSFVSPFFFVSPPGKVVCGIQRWILWTSFSIMFSALLVKVVRVARIFLQLRRGVGTRVRFTETRYQILFTLIFISVQWLILVISTGVFPPDVYKDVRPSESPNETPELLYTCEAENIVILVISVAYQTLLVLLCTILGVISFTYPENFNEAKHIAFCSFSVLVIWVAFIITFFATQGTREYHNIVLSLAVVMTGCAVYVTMFCHKMYIIVFHPERNIKRPTTTNTDNATLDATTISRKETIKETTADFAKENGQGTAMDMDPGYSPPKVPPSPARKVNN